MGYIMFVWWLACTVSQEKNDAVPVSDATATAHDSADEGTAEPLDSAVEPSEDLGAPLHEVGVLNRTTWNSYAQPLDITVWYPSSDDIVERYTYGWVGFEFEGGAQEELTALCGEPRPVIVHSHGNASVGWELYPLHERLASEGYIVVAPDHPSNTFYANTGLTAALTVQRPRDIQVSFDWLLEQSANPDSVLFGCVDPNEGYIASGFSFGGYTAYVLAGALVNDALGEPTIDLGDSRVQAALVYAPWSAFILGEGTRALEVPVLSLDSARDLTVGADASVLFSSVKSTPRASGQFLNGGHFTFAPQYCPYLPVDNGCGEDNVDPELAMAIIIERSVFFLEQTMVGETAGELDSSAEFSWHVWME